MQSITPEQSAELRAQYIHRLALALYGLDSSVGPNSATKKERAEALKYARRGHIDRILLYEIKKRIEIKKRKVSVSRATSGDLSGQSDQ